MGLFRQASDAGDVDELVFRDGDAGAPGQFKHPTRGFHDGGEFQRHAGERKAQRLLSATNVVVAVLITDAVTFGWPLVALKRRDHERGQVGA